MESEQSDRSEGFWRLSYVRVSLYMFNWIIRSHVFQNSNHDSLHELSTFTDPGHPGEALIGELDSIRKSLGLSVAVKKAFAAASNKMETADGQDIGKYLQSGFHTLLPSFVNLLQTFADQRRNFCLVLHGSPEDAETALDEIRTLCQGIHPSYSGNNKTNKFQMPGELLRLSGSIENGEGLMFDNGVVETEIQAMHAKLLYDTFERCRLVFIANKNDKLTGTYYDDRRVQQIFMTGDPSKVSITDPITLQQMPVSSIRGKAFFHIDQSKAALDPDYFVRAVSACESEFRQYLDSLSIRRMAETEEELSPRSYLDKHIMPTLLPVVELCCRDRPEDPLAYLAFNLLKYEETGYRNTN